MGNIHSHKLLLCIHVVLWTKVSVQFAYSLVMATACCRTRIRACCPMQWALPWGMSSVAKDHVIGSSKRGCRICSIQISHKSQDLPVVYQGQLNSSSGVSTIAKFKIIQRHVAPIVRLSWPGTTLPLVAILFLHQRRLWHLPGKATAEKKIPVILVFILSCWVWSVPSVSTLDQGPP